MASRLRSILLLTSALALTTGVAACGGGGGGVSGAQNPPASQPAPTETAPPSAPITPIDTSTPQLMAWDPSAPPGDNVRGRLLPARIAEPSTFETREYAFTNHANVVGASSAYARGITGAGVLVGVLDGPISTVNPELTGQVRWDLALNLTSTTDNTESFQHGSFVASIIAARKNDAGPQGVAYNAQIVPVTIFNGTTGRLDGNGRSYDQVLVAGYQSLRGNGVRVINHSFGSSVADYGNLMGAPAGLQDEWRKNANANIVMVWANGNEGTANPSWESVVPVQYPDLERAWLSVANYDPSTKALFTTSSRCGIAKNWCLAAPGTLVTGVGGDSGYAGGTGTSFSTSVVVGAVALVQQAWPNLTADEVRQVLFLSADDLGATGTDDTYGRGLLNLRRAFEPIGTVTVAQTGAGLTNTHVSIGGGFGDAVTLGLSGHRFTAYDSFKRDFSIAADSVVQERRDLRARRFQDGIRNLPGRITGGLGMASPGTGAGQYFYAVDVDGTLVTDTGVGATLRLTHGLLTAAYTRQGQGLNDVAGLTSSLGAAIPFMADANPFLALVGEGPAMSYRYALGAEWSFAGTAAGSDLDQERGMAGAATLAWDGGAASLRLTAGSVREKDTMLGAAIGGAFGGGNTDTTFTSLAFGYQLTGNLSLALDAHLGWMDRTADRSGFLPSAHATATGYGAAMQMEGAFGGTLVAALRQPLRAKGVGDFALLDADGLTRFQADLTPSGRELDLSLGWSRRLEDGAFIAAGFTHRFDADHVDGRQDSVVGVRWGMRF